MTASRPYTEQDIKRDPSLMGLAVSYATYYMGTWDVMANAQRAAQRTGTLTLPVARAVLNIARSDALVSDRLPEPKEPMLGFGRMSQRAIDEDAREDIAREETERRRETFVPKQEPTPSTPHIVHARMRPKFSLVWSGNQQYVSGRTDPLPPRYHVIDARSHVRYAPPYEPKLVFSTACGNIGLRNVSVGNVPPDDTYVLCGSCAKTIDVQRRTHDPEGWERDYNRAREEALSDDDES